MGTTANRNYPYPDPTDPADFPQAMQDLAEAVDTDITSLLAIVSPPPLMVVVGEAADNVISPSIETAMVYSTVNYDNDDIADLATSPDAFSVTTDGTYFAHFLAKLPDVTADIRALIRVDGNDFASVRHLGDAPASPLLVVSALLPNLLSTNVITTTVFQATATVQAIAGPRLTLYQVA
jgi:hypothetical protein